LNASTTQTGFIRHSATQRYLQRLATNARSLFSVVSVSGVARNLRDWVRNCVFFSI